jgi:hypothetical protein
MWERRAERTRPGSINHLAVADVLASHLWSFPRGPGDADALPNRLKDTVGRALTGRLLTRATLSLFVEAFGFSALEEDRLWRLWSGSPAISVLSGPRAMNPGMAADVAAVLGPRRHQTVSLHDHMYVGPDGTPDRARTLQVVQAVVDGLDSIPYLYDTNALTLEVKHGCGELNGSLRMIAEDLYATEIPLARTLALGETLTLEYWTSYRYPSNTGDPSEREYRRAVMGSLENYDMRLEFHPARLPAGLWWAVWDGMDGGVVKQEIASLDSQHSVHRYLRSVERSVVGFHWSWAAEPAQR